MNSDSAVIAINVLLKPDEKLAELAYQTNARFLQEYVQGFPLDETHVPHITLVQRYIYVSDLEKVIQAVSKMIKDTNSLNLKVKGFKSSKWETEGVAVLEVENSLELDLLEQKIVNAVHPFSVNGGNASAFVPNDNGIAIGQKIIKYVDEFVPMHSNSNYSPHLTIGLADTAFLHKLDQEPFSLFYFKPSAIAIYQLGDHGTARKELWSQKF
ncbi:2'-5' RNA ligase family protein [Solitalea longa]|nr:2'-5' RNA ligase family protein [Solitalea longa]